MADVDFVCFSRENARANLDETFVTQAFYNFKPVFIAGILFRLQKIALNPQNNFEDILNDYDLKKN